MMKPRSHRTRTHKIMLFQRICCTLLILLMMLPCIGGLFQIRFPEDYRDFYDHIDYEPEGEALVLDPWSILLSVRYLNSEEFFDPEDYTEENIEKDVLGTRRAAGIAYLILDVLEQEITVWMFLLTVLVFTLFLPCFLSVSFLLCITKYLLSDTKQTRRDTYKGVLNRFRLVLCQLPFAILLSLVSPFVTLTENFSLLLALCGVGILINIVASALKRYTKAQVKYRQMLQSVSIFGILLFLGFCVCTVRSNLVLEGVKVFGGRDLQDIVDLFDMHVDIVELLSLLFGILFMIGFFSMSRVCSNHLWRLGLTTPRLKEEDRTRGDAYPLSTLPTLLLPAVYLLLAGTDHSLNFREEEMAYFLCAMLCLVLLIFLEFLIEILKSTLCIDLDEGGREVVLQGTTYEDETEAVAVEELRSKGVIK